MTRAIYRRPWRVDVDVREGVSTPASIGSLVGAIAEALDAVHAPAPASIGLILTDDAEIAALNATHMGHRGPTDVLSFPLLPPTAFDPGAAAPDVPRPPGRRIHLGDIVVSVERAIEQAEAGRGGQTGDVRWSPADEMRLLVTHGTLHICGWDHATP
ncbi:MAG TPA: rRNA maturation RNase YbeY, partial [Solirubrobacterales bacterium]|nr:rRNA maturation RNase YbeY [Solirubrobacterales bacterium]